METEIDKLNPKSLGDIECIGKLNKCIQTRQGICDAIQDEVHAITAQAIRDTMNWDNEHKFLLTQKIRIFHNLMKNTKKDMIN